MKKVFISLIILLLISGCSNKVKPDFDSGFSIDTYRADMSGYDGLTSVNHEFKGITVLDLKSTLDEKGYGVFVLSRTGCDHCQLCMKYINEAAKELGVYVYYIDAESSLYPILNTDNYDILDECLKPIEEADETGEIVLQTPHFFTIINGEFVDSYVGASFKDDLNPTENEINTLIKKYKKAMEVFVE